MRNKRPGFTLIELLVVIAIIALLLSIVMPGLNMAKRKASAIACLANVRSLSTGWYLYQEDNDGWIMSCEMNMMADGSRSGGGSMVGWIGYPRDAADNPITTNTSATPVTDDEEIRGMKLGAVWPYNETPDSYNCPTDKVKSVSAQDQKLVTYSVPFALNRDPRPTSTQPQIQKMSQITSPGDRYVFLESAQQRNFISGGHFVLAAPELTGGSVFGWWDIMAVNHGDSSTIGFVDGHAENHKWQDSYTKVRISKLEAQGGGYYGQEYPGDSHDFPATMVTDLNYIAKGWAYRYKK